jgi:hypothetical protein
MLDGKHIENIGDPGWIRTSDLQLRRQVLSHFKAVLSTAHKHHICNGFRIGAWLRIALKIS